MSVTFRLHNGQRLCDICRDPKRCAKGSLGVLADTQTACQRHARKHHGGAAIQAVLKEAEEYDDQDSEGIGERAPSAEGEPAVLTRPCEEVEAAQDEEAGSSRGDFPVFDSPRSGKRKRGMSGVYRPLGKIFSESYQALMEGCQGEMVLKDRQIKGLQKELGLIKQTLGTTHSEGAHAENTALPV
ncbi:g7779 [Coccomyxa viridis]|uniref:G7779 protein n=1 Tax=Coccomyxa viridis TaxID=1274662 RepID=A0ABP1FYR1_9CHLO